jgi:hypothetical protein
MGALSHSLAVSFSCQSMCIWWSTHLGTTDVLGRGTGYIRGLVKAGAEIEKTGWAWPGTRQGKSGWLGRG